jgi:hypothetical protein
MDSGPEAAARLLDAINSGALATAVATIDGLAESGGTGAAYAIAHALSDSVETHDLKYGHLSSENVDVMSALCRAAGRLRLRSTVDNLNSLLDARYTCSATKRLWEEAAGALVAIGPEAYTAVRNRLTPWDKPDKVDDRRWAILVQIASPEQLVDLLLMAEYRHWPGSREVSDRLLALGPASVEPLARSLGRYGGDNRLGSGGEAVVNSLAQLKDSRAVMPLVDLLGRIDRYNSSDQKRVAAALGALGDTRAAEPLRKLVKDSLKSDKWTLTALDTAAAALGEIGDSQTVGLLADALCRIPPAVAGYHPTFELVRPLVEAIRAILGRGAHAIDTEALLRTASLPDRFEHTSPGSDAVYTPFGEVWSSGSDPVDEVVDATAIKHHSLAEIQRRGKQG